jgi:hypothetical protein
MVNAVAAPMRAQSVLFSLNGRPIGIRDRPSVVAPFRHSRFLFN